MSDGKRRPREIEQERLFETIQRHPDWDAQALADHLGYSSSASVRRYIKRYINRGELREALEVVPGPLRPLNHPFLIGVITDQQIYREPAPEDYPPGATYLDQESLTAYLIEHFGDEDVIVHDAMLVLGAPFDILLFVSSRRGIHDISPLITAVLRRYRGVTGTLTMSVGSWHRQ